MFVIRAATETDLPGITEIYNHAVLNTVSTFDLETKTLEDRRVWFRRHEGRLPVLVAVDEETIVGWASLSELSEKKAYRISAEISLYVRPGWDGRGIGTGLTEAVLHAGPEMGIHAVVARIAGGNEASLHILEKFGFRHVGVLKEVGSKFDRLLDVHLLQKLLPATEPPDR